ncbi:UNVERIFIED_CONTAM: hypothetical protein Sradi_4394800 [Sesamum radiatum]|uniref:RNase H type-1 domain-containing protein n=1 Tax=Sesamum radiatum TaxID=300843 RepID=A0AAW2NQ47_SESRA
MVLDTDKFHWFLVICWALWNRRCKKLAERESDDSLQLIDKTRQYFATFKEANEKQAKSSGVSQNAQWNPPSTGKIKINFDGATFKDPIGAGDGLIARDHNGHCGAWNHKFATSINEASMLKLWHFECQ